MAMTDLPDSTNEETSNSNNGFAAKTLWISFFAFILSLTLGICAVLTVFIERVDSAGIWFYILGFLALIVLAISILIAAVVGVAEIVKSIQSTFQK
jgi:uncharacterized membrane protein YdcZ (DUF606 family)